MSSFYICPCGASVEVMGLNPTASRRKAERLQASGGLCRSCYAKAKRAKDAIAHQAATERIADLTIVVLTGSERQVAWAETIRATKIAALRGAIELVDLQRLCGISDARWWINRRSTAAPQLVEQIALSMV